MSHASATPVTFVVTDIETDGHSHRAIDDVRGFANVLVKLLELNSKLPKTENTTGSYS